MNSEEYRKAILEKLRGKYYNRRIKSPGSHRRIMLKPTEIYKSYTDNNANIEEKQRFQEAAAVLLQMGIVSADYLKFSTDIEKLYLCEEKMDVLEEYLRAEYGMIPHSVVLQKVKEVLAEHADAGEAVRKYGEDILRQAEDPRNRLDVGRIEANLKVLHFLEENQEDLYIREVSMLVYGDSKWLEDNNYEEICNILRAVRGLPREENERKDAVLGYYHVLPAEQEIFIKGNWKIEWEDHILETAKLQGGIAIASGDIRGIRRITVRAAGLMTVENKTSYQRMGGGDMAYLYLGGFATRYQIGLLRQALRDNPGIVCYHFGDIDVGGFLIHRHLCRAVEADFILYRMGVEELKDGRFRNCQKALTDNDRNRMVPLLAEEEYKETLEYMEEHNVKLEQEIISYYLKTYAR